MKPIYLDHAAATPLDPEVLKAMQPFLTKQYANPNSLHDLGTLARKAIEKARVDIAKILHCSPHEIIFTSGGTESINLALKGIALHKKKGHIITSQIEHPAVLESCHYLEKNGFSVTYLPVDKYGKVSPTAVQKAIRRDTILISIMYANNEIGTIQPLHEIGKIALKHRIPFHTDACQAGSLDINVNDLNVALLTLNGNKIYGPKGIGILYKKSTTQLEPLLHGGNQEYGLRSGTENVPAIVGFAKALNLIQHSKEQENKRLTEVRDRFIKTIFTTISESYLNGHSTERLPNNIHLSFAGVEGEELLYHLNQHHIFVSTGSACNSHKIKTSHVLKAIKIPNALAKGSIRLTMGKETTEHNLQTVAKTITKIVSQLRLMD